ncbi:alpha-1,6-mannosyl-glycoprotein 2-beta-N-acetylglucosaminyltransferase isoform X1 [Lutzomyia longipalpis]|nr:alpha-1,6-mannosyl-glycoprotein 2-beta-N-acetylglucosaminyltransferase isoform X1 [Lutzomyia longipalpis]
MRGRRIQIPLPNTGTMSRRRSSFCLRTSLVIFLVLFIFLQLHIMSYSDPREGHIGDVTNDSTAAILSMVPPVLHKFLTVKAKNVSHDHNGSATNGGEMQFHNPNISEMKRAIYRYNEMQNVINEDIFGPLQNDSVIIVVQVHKRITYLRHLIVSLAQARDISKALLIFSHDHYDEDINELVQSVDFCKVMQIFYPYSIQTHPNEFPGADPRDCPRDMKKEQALIKKCNNALYPDLYGHYREAKFTQTKHHWWWKANRVFNELEVTRFHSGLVVFLEEDHYVAEDFLYLLGLMQKRSHDLCPKCNILSLGTYLKTFNYYTYSNNKSNKKAFFGQSRAAAASNSNAMGPNSHTNNNANTYHGGGGILMESIPVTTTEKYSAQWGYQVLPSLYSIYQKVEVTPWISSKHNMGMAFNRTTWKEIIKCAEHFCSYDDYNWDWSLQHVSQHCLKQRLHVMVVKGPRVFHIGECGVHHKKNNCESNQVISKVQKVLHIATKASQLFPKTITLTVASVVQKTKLRKGNGGWGDKRDHILCLNMTLSGR